jgi:predicted HTH transcriptional regulator
MPYSPPLLISPEILRLLGEIKQHDKRLTTRHCSRLKLNISARRVERYLAKCKDAKRLQRVGSARLGHWVVLNP